MQLCAASSKVELLYWCHYLGRNDLELQEFFKRRPEVWRQSIRNTIKKWRQKYTWAAWRAQRWCEKILAVDAVADRGFETAFQADGSNIEA